MGAEGSAKPAMDTNHGFVVLLIPMDGAEGAGKNASPAADTPVVVNAHAYRALGDGAHRTRSRAGRVRAGPTHDYNKTAFHTTYRAHGDGGTG